MRNSTAGVEKWGCVCASITYWWTNYCIKAIFSEEQYVNWCLLLLWRIFHSFFHLPTVPANCLWPNHSQKIMGLLEMNCFLFSRLSLVLTSTESEWKNLTVPSIIETINGQSEWFDWRGLIGIIIAVPQDGSSYFNLLYQETVLRKKTRPSLMKQDYKVKVCKYFAHVNCN